MPIFDIHGTVYMSMIHLTLSSKKKKTIKAAHASVCIRVLVKRLFDHKHVHVLLACVVSSVLELVSFNLK